MITNLCWGCHAQFQSSRSYVFLCTRYAYTEVARALLNAGAYIDAVQREQRTPLHLVSAHGHVDVARILLNRNANMEAKDFEFWRPLHLASRHGRLEVARLLVQHGAAFDVAVDNGRMRPLHMASLGCHVDVVRYLLDLGAQVSDSTLGFSCDCDGANGCSYTQEDKDEVLRMQRNALNNG